MASTVKHIRSSVAGRVPTTTQLELGSIAVNTYDGKLFIKKSVGGNDSIVEIGAGGGGGPILQSKQVINQNTSLTSGYNGLSIGDVEISNGYTVEVPVNSTWTLAEF